MPRSMVRQMDSRKPARGNLVISFLCYFVGAPVLTYFVNPNGLAALLLAYPLYMITWLYGKKWGFLAAAVGVAVNSVIWVAAGNGAGALTREGSTYVAVLYLLECVGAALFVLLVGSLRQKEVEQRQELERSRELLRISEEKYRTLIELAPQGIFVMEEGRITYCNDHALEMVGYARQEIVGKAMGDILFADDLYYAREIYSARAAGQSLPKSVTRLITKGGSIIWVETVGQRIEWEGRPAVLYLSSDISERRKAEEAARESERRSRISEAKYRSLVDGAPEAIWVVEEAKISFCNAHFAEMLGYRAEEMPGMPVQTINYSEDLDSAMARYAARAEGKILPKSITRQVRKDGSVIWVETIGHLIDWEGRPAVLYFSSDVTERKALEEQFVQAQKMEAIGRLAGGIAHDFNNLLQVILGFVSMMKAYPEDRKAIENDLSMIEDSATRAASLTQQLLAFSRKQVVQPKVLDLGVLVQQSEKMLSRVLGENITLQVELAEGESRIKADSGQMQQIILNLAINARDAMPDGGTITISVATVSEAPSPELRAGDYVRLSVSDTGRGMDAQTMGRIFEPFFTTKTYGTGTGLGLSIVYGIVRQNGGHILAHSRMGQGSTFVIHLPREFEPAAGAAARVEAAPHRGSGSILVVEDQPAVRHLVRTVLEQAGYTLTEAQSGEEAVRICRGRADGFDLLITDVVLTGMGDDEVASSIRALSPLTRAVFMSGYVDQEHLSRLNGASVLQKPFSASELLDRVKEALAGPR
jgi:two-component system, cell cycle sensor histidine kinase and response regulator CckA